MESRIHFCSSKAKMDEGVVLEDNVEKLSARCFCPMVQVGVFLQEGVALLQ
jgi:hypothetical protein